MMLTLAALLTGADDQLSADLCVAKCLFDCSPLTTMVQEMFIEPWIWILQYAVRWCKQIKIVFVVAYLEWMEHSSTHPILPSSPLSTFTMTKYHTLLFHSYTLVLASHSYLFFFFPYVCMVNNDFQKLPGILSKSFASTCLYAWTSCILVVCSGCIHDTLLVVHSASTFHTLLQSSQNKTLLLTLRAGQDIAAWCV